MSQVSQARRRAAQCSTCAMRHLCMPEGLSAFETEQLEDVISATRPVRRGEALFRTGDTFESLYAIRSGSIKTVVSREDGREQVTGLHLGGDALGLDGIGEGRHMSTAIALEDSSVCIVPYARFERMCRETSSIQRRLHQMMSREIVRETRQLTTLGTLRADERVARLLLDLSARFTRRGYASAEFTLRMTRDDIGSYLGITLETVSRTLSRFQARGLIDTRGKFIRINDFDALRAI